MKTSQQLSRISAALFLVVAVGFATPQQGFAIRTFQSLIVTPPSTNVTAGATISTNALGNLSFLTVDPDGHTNE